MPSDIKYFNNIKYKLADQFYSEHGIPYNIGMSKKSIKNLKKLYKIEGFSVRVFNPHTPVSQYYDSNENYLYVSSEKSNPISKFSNIKYLEDIYSESEKYYKKFDNKTITTAERKEFNILTEMLKSKKYKNKPLSKKSQYDIDLKNYNNNVKISKDLINQLNKFNIIMGFTNIKSKNEFNIEKKVYLKLLSNLIKHKNNLLKLSKRSPQLNTKEHLKTIKFLNSYIENAKE